MSTPPIEPIILRTAVRPPAQRGRGAGRRAFAPVAASASFAGAIAASYGQRTAGLAPLELALLARPAAGVAVQVHHHHHGGAAFTLAPRIDLTVLRWSRPLEERSTRGKPAARLECAIEAELIYRPRTEYGQRAANQERVQPGPDLPAPALRPARLERAIETELVYRHLAERVEHATSEQLVQRLLAREQRVEPGVPARSTPAAHAAEAGPPMVVHRPAPPPAPSRTPDTGWQAAPATTYRQADPQRDWMQAGRARQEIAAPAPAPPNVRQVADEVLQIIDRRLVAARERTERG